MEPKQLRGHSTLKMSQGGYTTPSPGSQGVWEEPQGARSPSAVQVPTQMPSDKTNMAFPS